MLEFIVIVSAIALYAAAAFSLRDYWNKLNTERRLFFIENLVLILFAVVGALGFFMIVRYWIYQ